MTLEAESDVFLRMKSLRVAVAADKIDESDTTGGANWNHKSMNHLDKGAERGSGGFHLLLM